MDRSASLATSLIGCDVMRQSCLQRFDWPRDTIDFSKTYRDWPMVNVCDASCVEIHVLS